uniref:ZP domain-containing protein n=1 Tax=Heterorhabditis bacteriophora TaxID=37862 RepID=A0A1I7XEW7_HETBA
MEARGGASSALHKGIKGLILIDHFTAMLRFLPLLTITVSVWGASPPVLDNGVAGLPEVDCMEDRVRLTFKTQRPFQGRIFVKGLVEKDPCVNNYLSNTNKAVTFELRNGDCNMRRTRMLSPEQRGVEQSITVIISFHSTFITKVDRAYRCTCFYMEADKVVTSRFDVSMLPTTDLIDTARMPLCTYSVRKDSVTGPIAQYAQVGEALYHVWQCESDMFSMLVHSCFVDDGNGQDRKPLLDEHGCAIDPIIVPDLVYNKENNLAFVEVNAFKFADKISTYFQCAVSTCMISEGMCVGKTPPRCGPAIQHFRIVREVPTVRNKTHTKWVHLDNTMDLSAQKITVLDLEENGAFPLDNVARLPTAHLVNSGTHLHPVCIGPQIASVLTALSAFSVLTTAVLTLSLVKTRKQKNTM